MRGGGGGGGSKEGTLVVLAGFFFLFLARAWLAKAKDLSCHTKKSTLAKTFTEKYELKCEARLPLHYKKKKKKKTR